MRITPTKEEKIENWKRIASELSQQNARLQEQIKQAEAVCDSYAKENQQFSDTIDRLRAELEIAKQSDTDYQAHIENARLQALLGRHHNCGLLDKTQIYQHSELCHETERALAKEGE